MATVRQLIRDRSREGEVPFWIVEKDYALSYLLLAVSQTEGLRQSLVLKGGTALRKAYFEGYRFSEDIDYSTRTVGPLAELDRHIEEAVDRAQDLLADRGPFTAQYERESLKEPHPAGQASFIIRVQFPYHRKPDCRLKLEITVDEPLLLPPQERPILHEFSEDLRGRVQTYDLAEIAAEKLRALLQSQARIDERGWATSRVARDYYDLWFLLSNVDFTGKDLPGLVREKALVREVKVTSPDDFFTPSLQDAARREWEQQLIIFVPTAPEADQVLAETMQLVRDLWT